MRTMTEIKKERKYRQMIYPFNRIIIDLKTGKPITDNDIIECKHEIFKSMEEMKKKLNRRKITFDVFKMLENDAKELNRCIDKKDADEIDFQAIRFCLNCTRNMV